MNYRFLLLILVSGITVSGQQISSDSLKHDKNVIFKYSALYIPAGLLTYGIVGIKNDPINRWDKEIRNSLKPDGVKIAIDDYTPYLPIAAVYGLNLLGIEGKNNLMDRSIILGTSTLFVYTSVNLIKNNTNIRRPSGRSQSAFPSGHTAIAFMAAEFMHQEYGEKSYWYSIGAYTVAASTGFLRIYNDKHWLTDVAAGAAFGILSTKLAYWLYPSLKNIIFKNKNKSLESEVSLNVAPLYNGNEWMLATSLRF